jgi:hypothetical protein
LCRLLFDTYCWSREKEFRRGWEEFSRRESFGGIMACSVVKVLAVSSALALATTCDAFLTAPSLRPATSTLRAAGSRQGRCSTVAPSMVLTPDRRTASAPTGFGDNARQPPSKVSTCARAAPRCHRNKILAAPLLQSRKKHPRLFSGRATLAHRYRPFAST